MEPLLLPLPIESWLIAELLLPMEPLPLPIESWLMAEPAPVLPLPLLMLLWLMVELLPILPEPMLPEDCAKAALTLARERTQAVMVRMRGM